MYCEKCGQKLDSDEKFCRYCGAKVLSSLDESDESSQENMLTDAPIVPKKKKTVLIAGLAVLAVTLSVAVFFIWNFAGQEENPVNKNVDLYTEAEARRDSSADIPVNSSAETQMEEPAETKTPETKEPETGAFEGTEAPVTETVPPETEPAMDAQTGQLPGVGAASPSAPTSAEDFIRVSSPDGAYSFMYPANYFQIGEYDEEDGSYFLMTGGDGEVTVRLYKIDAPVPGDPYASAERMYENYKGDFLEGAECPYVHRSSGVADDGYSRMIISGPYAEMTNGLWAGYCCTASNGNSTYIMYVSYPAKDRNGTGVEKTPTGYVLDCLYRGWSLGGSTYEIRSYAQYMADEMGSKKPGES